VNQMMDDLRLADVDGQPVLDRSGDEVGTVQDLYYDENDHKPSWVVVKRGRRASSLVPLRGAERHDGSLIVPYDRSVVEAAPDVSTEARLGSDDERRLLEHYRNGAAATRGAPSGGDRGGRTFRTVAVPNEIVSIRVVDVDVPGDGPIQLRRQDIEIDRRPWQDGDERRQPAPEGVTEIVLTREEFEQDDRDHDRRTPTPDVT
jgi:sporulation protein YlmC with PRC-barrel domain